MIRFAAYRAYHDGVSCSGHSPASAAASATENEVVRYLEREAAEGSEAIEAGGYSARSTATTPMDPRLTRSVSQARSEDAYSSVKLTPTSPLLPLEQLLMQQDDVSGKLEKVLLEELTENFTRENSNP